MREALVALVVLIAAAATSKYEKDLSDARLQAERGAVPCSGVRSYRCASGECIKPEWVCDTDKDCDDGSDESAAANCSNDCTGSHQFLCDNSRCISASLLCDGNDDCQDTSDEQHCHLLPCPPGRQKCANHLCVEQVWFCDGQDDCGDGSDEKDCDTTCRDQHSVQLCDRLNRTANPVCLDKSFAYRHCRRFCHLCDVA